MDSNFFMNHPQPNLLEFDVAESWLSCDITYITTFIDMSDTPAERGRRGEGGGRDGWVG